MVIDEVAEIGMATESLADYPNSSPCPATVAACTGHATQPPPGPERAPGLDDIAHEPLITYHPLLYRTRQDRPGLCDPPPAAPHRTGGH